MHPGTHGRVTERRRGQMIRTPVYASGNQIIAEDAAATAAAAGHRHTTATKASQGHNPRRSTASRGCPPYGGGASMGRVYPHKGGNASIFHIMSQIVRKGPS